MIDPALSAEKMENAHPMQPTEPIDRMDPADPIDRIDPAHPIDRIEPDEPIDRIEPLDPKLSIELAEPPELDEPLLVPMTAFSHCSPGWPPVSRAKPDSAQ